MRTQVKLEAFMYVSKQTSKQTLTEMVSHSLSETRLSPRQKLNT